MAEQRLSQVERSNLVAYLDGELNEVESRAIATKLTQSVSARREVEALEKTWELLDQLPRPQVSPELTTRTLAHVTGLASPDERLAVAARGAARRLAKVLACALTVALGLGLGFAATRWLWPDPTARLARDLSLAEHLDEYRDVGSFEFLRLLDETPDVLD